MKKYKVEYYPYGFPYATYYVEAENEEQAVKIAAFQARVKPEDFKAKNFVVHKWVDEHYITYNEIVKSLNSEDKEYFQKIWYHSMK